MMFVIGVYLLFLSIIMDDFTSYILLYKGFGILETNPIYQTYGLGAMILVQFLSYIFMIFAWWFFIKLYRKFYKSQAVGYKIYDIFIFFGCLILISITTAKIDIGFENINTMVSYIDDEKKQAMDENIEEAKILKQNQPEIYNEISQDVYNQGIIDGISYTRMILNSIFAFLLFRVGYKVCPWDMA